MKVRRSLTGLRLPGLKHLRLPTRLLPRKAGWARDAVLATYVFTAAVLAGLAFARFVLFPAPVFVQETAVPRLLGMSRDAAVQALRDAGFRATAVEVIPHPTYPGGQVAWQDPVGGTLMAAGTDVALFVSAGPQRVAVPDVAGYDQEIARTLIGAAGLAVGPAQSAQTAAPRGVVVATRPPVGSALPPGGRVALVVSAGAPTIPVPAVLGLTLTEARAAIEAAGLRVGTYFARTTPDGIPGTVIEQNPHGGTLAAAATAVDLIIARRGAQ